MRGLSEAEVLGAWEHGQGRGAHERAVAPLQALDPGHGMEELMALPLGTRDRRLLELRAATLGPVLAATAACPACGANADFAVAVEDLLAVGTTESAAGEAWFSAGGYELRLRTPDSRDLAAAAASAGLGEARALLLERLVVEAREGDREVAAAELPEEVVAALGEELDRRDPLAVTPLALVCERCDHDWQPLFDAAAFVWRELAARAERVMADVHELARSFGWSEAEALAVGPARRRFYLEQTPAAGGQALS